MSDVEHKDKIKTKPRPKKSLIQRVIFWGYVTLNTAFIGGLVWVVAPAGFRAAEDWRQGHVVVSVSQAPEIRDLAKSLTHWDFQQIDCLAKNAYFEARGEGNDGINRVLDVVLNRASDLSRYPDGPCQVITERGQFSWYSDGRDHTIRDYSAYNRIYTLSYNKYVYRKAGLSPDLTGGARHYHNTSVHPRWPWQRLGQWGNHIFYR